jgi:hypothetical protein
MIKVLDEPAYKKDILRKALMLLNILYADFLRF